MDIVTLIGAAAGIASVVSFTPQAWKIIKTRDTRSLSARMYSITVTGFALWLAYGILKQEWPIIAANGICLLLSGFILLMKILPQKGKDAIADALDPSGR